MPDINYIKHLNTVFEQFSKDNKLNPTHISLYVTLFQHWNLNKFNNPLDQYLAIRLFP